MACDIQLKVIDQFKKEGLIKPTREIISHNEFNIANERYSQLAKDQYNVSRDDLLFNVITLEKTKLRGRTIFRAEPNEDFFNVLDNIENPIIEDTTTLEKKLLSLDKPVIEFDFMTNSDLIALEDPIQAKVIQDQIKKDKEDLDNLINCLWS